MKEIVISKNIIKKLPELLLGVLKLDVKIEPSSGDLKQMLDNRVKELEETLTPVNIREIETIKANKDAYRKLGKDPNRYRPASESLMRRVANGKGLYFINNVVDILNLISINTGYSICGYNYEKINGDITFWN